MKQCIIADFEWCVTPHPHGSHFQYFNEILSAGAVRIDETGTVLDRFYMLIRPLDPEFVHPVILNALRLDRTDLAKAPDFRTFLSAFRAFVCVSPDRDTTGMQDGSCITTLTETEPGLPPVICTWGSADRAALLQNLRVKGGYTAENAAKLLPPMRDLQPILCRAADIRQPYPGLASLLSVLGLENTGAGRHNALSDAEDTARIAAHFAGEAPSLIAPLFARTAQGTRSSSASGLADATESAGSTKSAESPDAINSADAVRREHPAGPADTPGATPDDAPHIAPTLYRTPGDALNAARNLRRVCPVCGEPMGCGTWIRASRTEFLTLFSCETDGRFLCSLTAEAVPIPGALPNIPAANLPESPQSNPEPPHPSLQSPQYTASAALLPFEDAHKARYEAARRAARLRRMRKLQNSVNRHTAPLKEEE